MEKIVLIEGFLGREETSNLFDFLFNNIDWKEELTVDDGSKVKIKRKMSYVYEKEIDYKYARLSFRGETWNEKLAELRDKLNNSGNTFVKFNSVLLNLYKNGKDEIKWHSDKEKELGENAVIACINLGATRKFWFREKGPDKEPFFITVKDGDLLIMDAGCQEEYLHAILKESEVTEPRISLTFRNVIYDD